MTTKLEQSNKALTALAAEVDLSTKIHYHGGAYWIGDVQLTYDRAVKDGCSVTLDWPGKVALAEEILRRILQARVDDPLWGDRWGRQRRVLVGLREEIVPTFRRGSFCHWRYLTGDDGCLFASGFSGTYTAWVTLALDPRDSECKAEGRTLEGAIEALWDKLAPAGERPPWHGPADVMP